MKSPSFRDIELLSAYLDGQISPSERTRLEKRLQRDAGLRKALKDLSQTRAMLRRVPQRRAPRNFTLTPKMAGIRPPVPRLVPAFSWASAVAMLMFLFTLGTSLVRQLPIGAAAPMSAAAPSGKGGGPPQATEAPAAPLLASPPPAGTPVPTGRAATGPATQETPTPELFAESVPEASPLAPAQANQPPSTLRPPPTTFSPWLVIWPGLGVLLGLLAVLVWRLNIRAFRRKNKPK